MKKTISLTEDQVCELMVTIRLDVEKMKKFRQLDLEDGNEKGAARWGERIRALEQAEEKIRRAKWRR